jgi:hypothetical protein
MASLLQAFIDPKKNWFARQHMKAISQRLRKYGWFNPNFHFIFFSIYQTLISFRTRFFATDS